MHPFDIFLSFQTWYYAYYLQAAWPVTDVCYDATCRLCGEAATACHHLRGSLTSLSLLNLCVCSVCEWSPAGLACFVWLVASRSLSVVFVMLDAAGPALAALV